MQSLGTFDEVHVVSDLHLGGADGFQIFGQGVALARVIDHLRAKPAKVSVAFVINGDFVDFLAEEPALAFDPLGAVAKLDRIRADPSFSMVFDALARFAATPNRSLVVNLGNHDLEIALPWVREHVLRILSKDKPDSAPSRIRILTDGAGFPCRVGTTSVLCVHGNEVDAANPTDHETIRRIGRDLARGLDVPAWEPNFGSRLVIEVMNDLKRKWRFVDLLKPEVGAVIPTLLALDPSAAKKIARLPSLAVRLASDWVRKKLRFLSEDDVEALAELELAAEADRTTRIPSAEQESSRNALAKDLLDRAEARMSTESTQDPLTLVQGDASAQSLGLPMAGLWLARGEPVEALREAMEGLEKDRSFEHEAVDSTFERLDEGVGTDVDILVAGHTHLARALPRRHGGGFYFNSGTWAYLIALKRDVLKSPQLFKHVFEVLGRGSMKALLDEPNLVTRLPTVVSICKGPSSTLAELRRATLDPAVNPLVPVDRTQFTRT